MATTHRPEARSSEDSQVEARKPRGKGRIYTALGTLGVVVAGAVTFSFLGKSDEADTSARFDEDGSSEPVTDRDPVVVSTTEVPLELTIDRPEYAGKVPNEILVTDLVTSTDPEVIAEQVANNIEYGLNFDSPEHIAISFDPNAEHIESGILAIIEELQAYKADSPNPDTFAYNFDVEMIEGANEVADTRFTVTLINSEGIEGMDPVVRTVENTFVRNEVSVDGQVYETWQIQNGLTISD